MSGDDTLSEAPASETPTRRQRWLTAHEGHAISEETLNGHRLTLCRDCDDLNYRDCGG